MLSRPHVRGAVLTHYTSNQIFPTRIGNHKQAAQSYRVSSNLSRKQNSVCKDTMGSGKKQCSNAPLLLDRTQLEHVRKTLKQRARPEKLNSRNHIFPIFWGHHLTYVKIAFWKVKGFNWFTQKLALQEQLGLQTYGGIFPGQLQNRPSSNRPVMSSRAGLARHWPGQAEEIGLWPDADRP